MQVAVASDIMVMNAMARASLTPVAKSGAVYFSIMNHGADDDVLVSISTPIATSAEVHETKMDGDVMQMRALEKPLVDHRWQHHQTRTRQLARHAHGFERSVKKGRGCCVGIDV